MIRSRLYIDEDAMQTGLVDALRARRVDLVTALEAGMINRSDEEHLARARDAGRALYSFNMGDYAQIHADWLSRGERHAGIILAPQTRFSIGEQVRRLLNLLDQIPPARMGSRVEYLNRWGLK
jgi:hypothetical protein